MMQDTINDQWESIITLDKLQMRSSFLFEIYLDEHECLRCCSNFFFSYMVEINKIKLDQRSLDFWHTLF